MWRALVAVVGTVIVIAGLVLVVLPGPGWLIVFVGLAVLATEFTWAEHVLAVGRATLEQWTGWMKRQPRWRSGLVGALGLVLLAAVLLLVLRWYGTPGWVPQWVPLVR